MYINKNNVLANVKGIEMVMNLENGAVVGVK